MLSRCLQRMGVKLNSIQSNIITCCNLLRCSNSYLVDNVAISFNNIEITYKELIIKTNKICSYLKEAGVGQGDIVGVLLNRSIETVNIIISIIKAGAAYLPLDPSHPQDRNAYIIEDSNIKLLIADGNLGLDNLGGDLKIINVEDIDVEKFSGEDNQLELNSESLAYVIYTSGSTGKPKGVEIKHTAVVNVLNSIQKRIKLNNYDKMLAVTSISFDISVLEIFLPLMAGAKLIMADKDTAFDYKLLKNIIEQEKVSILQATPVTWRLLLDSGWKGNDRFKIICGGETLTKKLASGLLSCCAELWNAYGPTETTIWSTFTKIEDAEIISIGNPLDNTDLYILDENMESTDEGELYIGGIGLAKGYLCKSDLTEEKFVYIMCGNKKQRVFKTNDLVKKNEKGAIEFLCRNDFQCKVRGFRIELEEIECVAEKLPEINRAIACLKEKEEDKELVLYYQVLNGEQITIREIRNQLKEHLPEYMLPIRYICVNQFPLTVNNKIDRKSMHLVEENCMCEEILKNKIVIENMSETERLVFNIWDKILELNEIDLDGHFFDLGGHSLSASRIIGDLEERFNIEISQAEFLIDGYSIRNCAKLIKNKQNSR